MGYTQYYRTEGYKFSPAKFAEVKAMLNKILQTASKAPWHIETEIDHANEHSFYFNGVEDEGHETFFVHRDWPAFNFCKTAHKPYDTCVTASLLLLNLMSRGKITLSSDGDRGDWVDGFRLLNQALPGIYSQYAHRLPQDEFNFALTDKELIALKLRTKLDLKAKSKIKKKAILLFSETSLVKLSLFKIKRTPIIRATAQTLNLELVKRVRELAEDQDSKDELDVTLPYLLQGQTLLADLLYLAALTSDADVVAIIVPDQAKVFKRLLTISKQQVVINVALDLEAACANCFYPSLVKYQESMGTLEETLALLATRK